MKLVHILFLTAAVVALAGVGVFFWLRHDEPKPPPHKTLVARKSPIKQANRAQPKRKPKASAVGESAVRERNIPVLDRATDDVDENGVKLTEEMKGILRDLQDALDNEDRHKLTKVCSRIQAIQRERGQDAVPVSVRSAAVEAIGNFLPATLSELVGFMADSDPEVIDSALSQLDNMLNDTTIGDKELSTLFSSLSKVLTDEDAVDSMVLTIEGNMRNSVRVQSYEMLLDSGTPQVVSRLRTSIAETLEIEPEELPTDNEAVKAKLEEWLQDNPDGEDDNDLYNGV